MARATPTPEEERVYNQRPRLYRRSVLWSQRRTRHFYGKYGEILCGGLAAVLAYFKNRQPVAWFAVGVWAVSAGVIVTRVAPRLAAAICLSCREGVERDATAGPHCRHAIQAVPASGLLMRPLWQVRVDWRYVVETVAAIAGERRCL
jgi:hypothetical protein